MRNEKLVPIPSYSLRAATITPSGLIKRGFGRVSHFSFSLLICHFSFLILLASCGSSSDKFRLEGRFKNLNQGDFYFYDTKNGRKDTIHVRDGRFEYEREVDRPVTCMLMFPNFSQLPVFAESGVTVNIKGDASHLRETKITGSKANEEMTEFRMAMIDQTLPEQQRLAALYVGDHPSSPIALYLVQRFFIENIEPDYQQALKLCKTITQEQPDNMDAKQLQEQLEQLKNYATKGSLPRFKARDTNGHDVSNAQLKNEANVLILWSSWHYESQNILRMLKRKQKEYPGRLSVVSICLDASASEGRKTLERDSITWPNVCDGLMWQSPVLAQLGLATAGASIVTDKQGKIVARNLESTKLREKLESLLKK